MAAASLVPLRWRGPQFTTPLMPNPRPLRFCGIPPFPPRSPPPPPPVRASPSSASGSSSTWEREEARWLREEQRWLREEQRWLREESRWNSQRESFLREIAALKLRIEALERERPPVLVPDPASAKLESPLRASKDRVAPAEGGTRTPPALAEEPDVKEMVLGDISVPEAAVQGRSQGKEKWKSLRKGAEGEDVRAMQEALESLGFYSGEEDIESAFFSSGTERAVKTWQASLGTLEDGIMTSELLERLFMELEVGKVAVNKRGGQKGDSISVPEKDGANGAAAVTSLTGFTEIQQTIVKDDGTPEVEVSEQRVFLLGENRWEEPSRLVSRDNLMGNKGVSSTKCFSCHGEGRVMCTECDGSGEPNIEPQFLEWVDEGAKCPYCDGLGYTICDVCEGKAPV